MLVDRSRGRATWRTMTFIPVIDALIFASMSSLCLGLSVQAPLNRGPSCARHLVLTSTRRATIASSGTRLRHMAHWFRGHRTRVIL